jgi:hypothetical protein
MSAAVDYLDLKEARQSGREARWIAIVSIVIGVIVGIAQIFISYKQMRTESNIPKIILEVK